MPGHQFSPLMLTRAGAPTAPTQPAVAATPLAGVWRRQWRVAVGLAVLVFAVVFAVGMLLPKRYQAEAYVTIPANPRDAVPAGSVVQDTPGDETTLLTEMQVLQSPWLVRRTIEALRHDGTDAGIGLDDDWQGDARAVLTRLEAATGVPLPRLAGTQSAPPPEILLQIATERVGERLTVVREAGSRVIRIRFWSRKPERAAMVVNTLITEYQRAQVSAKLGATRDLGQVLDGPLRELQDNARKAEEAVEAFRRASGLVDINDSPLISKQIVTLTDLLTEAQARRQDYEARVRALASGAGIDSVPEVLESRLISQLREQQSQLGQSVVSLAGKFSDDNARVVEAREKMADLQHRIDGEIQRIASGIRRQAAIQQQREAAIRQDIDRHKVEYERINQALVKVHELEREAQASRVLVNSFLERHKQIQVQSIVAFPNAMVLNWADVSWLPSYPQLPMVFAVSLGLALASGAATAGLREFRRAGFSSLEEFELTLFPAAGIVPVAPSRLGPPEDQVMTNPQSVYAEAYRKLLTATTLIGDTPPRSVLVSSSLPGEGKTATLLSLARLAAYGGRRVVVVDCDLRNPGLDRCLGKRPATGLADVLEGRCRLDEVVRRDRLDRIDVIPAGRPKGELFDILAGGRMGQVIASLAEDYGLVLVDSPPSAMAADTRILAGLVDAVLFCVQWRTTPTVLAQAEVGALLADGRMTGVVLTKVDLGELAPHGRRLARMYAAYHR